MWGREGDLMRPVKTVQLTALMGGWREGRLAEGGARPRGRRCPGRGMELVRYVGNGLLSTVVAGATRRALARTRSQRGRMRRGPEAVCPMMAVTDGYNVLEWAGGGAGELGFEGD